jgi:hypothetical protein
METYQIIFNGTLAKTEKRNGHLSCDQREPSPLILYTAGSAMYFDKSNYSTGGTTPYMNPRTTKYYDSPHPTYGAKSSYLDYLIPIFASSIIPLL